MSVSFEKAFHGVTTLLSFPVGLNSPAINKLVPFNSSTSRNTTIRMGSIFFPFKITLKYLLLTVLTRSFNTTNLLSVFGTFSSNLSLTLKLF